MNSLKFSNKIAMGILNKLANLPLSLKASVSIILLGSYYLWKTNKEDNIAKFQLEIQKRIVNQRPKRIILVCNGESQNTNIKSAYSTAPSYQIELSQNGIDQAMQLGNNLKQIIGNESVRFYVSPWKRAKETFQYLIKSFTNEKQYNYEEDPRLREQEFGNLYDKIQKNNQQEIKNEKKIVGKFFYRYLNGESGADVYDRCTMFLDTLLRRIDNLQKNKYENYVIVTHKIVMQLFLMRYFKLSVEQFENLKNPKHCEIWILQKNTEGYFELQQN